MNIWLKKVNVWGLKWANTKWGGWAMFIFTFADASYLPLPSQMFFVSLTLLNVKKAYHYALYASFGLLFGAITGYATGHLAWLNSDGSFTGFAQFMFNNMPGFSVDKYNEIRILFAKWDFWILFSATLTPIPFNFLSILSGVFNMNLFMFSFVTLLSQGLKFYLLAFLVVKMGVAVKKIFEINFKPIAIITTVCIAIVIIVVKVLN